MNERISMKPGNMLYPLPVVLVSCGITEEEFNVITIAWTGTINTNPPMLSISVRPERHSYHLIRSRGEFVVNLPLATMVKEVDFCGVKSGRDVNKMKHCNFKSTPSEAVQTPSIAQCPVSIECRVSQEVPLGSHSMFIAEVVAVTAWDSIHNKRSNAIELKQLPLLIYTHGGYFVTGKQIGSFGFSVRKKTRQSKK